MDSEWVPISPLSVPYPCFEIGKNPNTYPNPVKTEKTRQIEFYLSGYRGIDFIAIPIKIMCDSLFY